MSESSVYSHDSNLIFVHIQCADSIILNIKKEFYLYLCTYIYSIALVKNHIDDSNVIKTQSISYYYAHT